MDRITLYAKTSADDAAVIIEDEV